jgi:hypothetical protein
MTLTLAAAERLWERLRVPVEDGLTAAELRRVEQTFEFKFNPDHRALLSAGLPMGGRWPNWREPESVRDRLDEPVDGVIFDVEENGFWFKGWGARPPGTAEAVRAARRELKRAPRLVPIYGHRFSPALPQFGLPVFSVVQTDVVVYGQDLVDYLIREFGGGPETPDQAGPVQHVPFWSELT